MVGSNRKASAKTKASDGFLLLSVRASDNLTSGPLGQLEESDAIPQESGTEEESG
jgi:hypothetical protein